MNLRKTIYFIINDLRGIKLGNYYNLFWKEYQNGIPSNTTENLIEKLLDHCNKNIPYYSRLIKEIGDSYHNDPIGYLQNFPILTKDDIRKNFKEIQSKDINKGKWFYMTSGGSTGEPGKVIQDFEFVAKSGAIKLLFSRIIGKEIGEQEIFVWGSERDIIKGNESLKVRLLNCITNSIFVNAFRLTPEKMLQAIRIINIKKPKLLIAYAESLTGLAQFVEKNHIPVTPQNAIITSAGTLYPFMREIIEKVFHCRVYNRYGSRELGDIACERPGKKGLWVAPWGNFIEIVDQNGKRVSDGCGGEILITSLTNYAMPLIRYRICDYGILQPKTDVNSIETSQVFQQILGRATGLIRKKDGTLIEPGYIVGLFYFKDWIKQFQIIQISYSKILLKIAVHRMDFDRTELNNIIFKIKLVLGEECVVEITILEEISYSNSGKFQFFISEIVD